MNKKLLLLVITGIFLLAIPITVLLTREEQTVETKANVTTTLDFSPASSTTNPIQKNINDAMPMDIIINPGNNLVTFVRLQVKFDSQKLALANENAFVTNTAAFPTIIEGPVKTTDTIAVSVSVGSDPTKAISVPTKLGTINFKAIGSTSGTPTQISYTALTQALSVGSNDQAGQNVLSTASPAFINITGTTTPSVTTGPTGTTNPTGTTSATITAVPTGKSTVLSLNLLLHGVGSAGDNPNPRGSSLSNKNPLHPQRDITLTITDKDNKPVIEDVKSSVIYDADKGSFIGTIDLGPSFPAGSYSIKVKTDRYLRKLVPAIVNVKALSQNQVPETALVAGDIKDDNVLNVLDYNIMLDCGYGAVNPLPIADPNSLYHSSNCNAHGNFRPNADLEDNGIVNSADYNLFLRELSVQNGD